MQKSQVNDILVMRLHYKKQKLGIARNELDYLNELQKMQILKLNLRKEKSLSNLVVIRPSMYKASIC